MLTCGLCGKELEQRNDTTEAHYHEPDIFLNVRNCGYALGRTRYFGTTMETETLDFTIPETWATWVFDCCGGDIKSGMYRLPGKIWEWCLAKLRNDEGGAAFIAKQIDQYLEYIGDPYAF